MRRTPRAGRRCRARILGGLTLSLLLPLGPGALAGPLAAQPAPPTTLPAVVQAPALSGPLTLPDCLRIAWDQQPALAAHRASLAAAQAQASGLQELRAPPFIARDLPIRRRQACLGQHGPFRFP